MALNKDGDMQIVQKFMPEAGRDVWEIYKFRNGTWFWMDIVEPKEGVGNLIKTPFSRLSDAAEAIIKLESGEWIVKN